jgi:quinohemoprotein ethanol dehydrogenase
MTLNPLQGWLCIALLGALAGTVDAGPLKDDGLGAEADGTNWPAYGRTYDETHASPLRDVNADNVSRLGLSWSLELPDVHNGGTVPLAVDGIIYFTVDQSIVHAVDARSGKLLWRFDPEVGKVAGIKLRYAWGPRGIAYWHGKVFVGTTDGRLIGIDARTGRQLWSQMTVEPNDVRIITGPPRVLNGKVIIGHGGADYGPVRGYVTAYDSESGKQLWRFYTVPGNPADGFENAAMKMAAPTWTGEWWKGGGGGTVWNAMTYDRELNRVYIGVGNGSPWDRKVRSPGGGDNLFLCSIVALDADTGEYVWHYQTTPGEMWDYNSAMDMTLATLQIAGIPRKVLLHAPKNGFFYVVDRTTGKLISAEKFSKVTWAERVDPTTGRPVEAPNARYDKEGVMIWPGNIGAHSWAPMSFNSMTGLVYIPTVELGAYYPPRTPDDPVNRNSENPGKSELSAWDPIRQRQVWHVATPGVWNGGTLTTAGNLVFQGQADGKFNAYAADSGKRLWWFDAKMGISGAPITYTVQGRQYISLIAGWGGSVPGYLGAGAAQYGWVARIHSHRLLTFALDAKGRLPENLPPPVQVKPIDDPGFVVDPAKAQQGHMLFALNCGLCHGYDTVGGGYAPDLRASPVPLSADAFAAVVKQGGLTLRGMPKFDEFTDEQLEALRHHIRARAREALEAKPSAMR